QSAPVRLIAVAKLSRDQPRVQGIEAGDGGLIENMPLHGVQDFLCRKAAFYWKFLNVERIHGEDITVNDGIIPGRARAVVAEVVPVHVAVTGEPTGVIVQTLARAVQRQRTGLTSRRNAIGV